MVQFYGLSGGAHRSPHSPESEIEPVILPARWASTGSSSKNTALNRAILSITPMHNSLNIFGKKTG
ncbi:MAG: hypothetical protein R3C26_24705 [Calditrichia bacterium]